ncbi:MAG: hypothetical protein V1774_05505 [Candidatus Eisenbacteria bacterium]
MWSIAIVLNGIFSVIFAPFRGMHPWIGLLVISIVTGVVMLLIFGKTSNQSAIRRAKSKLKAHIAEIWLFRDDLPQMLIAFFRVLGNTGLYFAHSLRPLIFIMVPVLVIMVMLGSRYEHRPLKPGETATVAVQVRDAAWTRDHSVSLEASDGLEVLSPPLRIPARREIDWKIRATQPGEHHLTLVTPAGEQTKQILVRESESPLTALAPSRGTTFSSAFLSFPIEPPLPGNAGIRSFRVTDWPARELQVLGLNVHWLVAFFVVSLVAGFAVKGVFRIEV